MAIREKGKLRELGFKCFKNEKIVSLFSDAKTRMFVLSDTCVLDSNKKTSNLIKKNMPVNK